MIAKNERWGEKGDGSEEVHCTRQLDVRITGIGTVEYLPGPGLYPNRTQVCAFPTQRLLETESGQQSPRCPGTGWPTTLSRVKNGYALAPILLRHQV
jgi:hypothetical protein